MIVLNVILFLANFLRTLLFVLILYYVIRFIGRYILPFFRNVYGQPGATSNDRNPRPEGEVRVEGNQSQKSRVSRDEGEYVDFEEVN